MDTPQSVIYNAWKNTHKPIIYETLDAKGNPIKKEVDFAVPKENKFYDPEYKGRCNLCGEETHGGIPIKKMFSSNYMDWPIHKEPDSTHICEACAFCIGMRKAESKQRTMTLGSRGLTYFTKTRNSVTCCPIGKLTDDDIWAYIVSNNLPYLSCYDNPLFDRRKIRNELNYLCTKKAIFQGIVEKYKFIYPEIFAELRSRYEGINSYM